MAIEHCLRLYNPAYSVYADELYVTLYYFFKTDLSLDTDNLSKPVWDCLSGVLFNDDKQIKMRVVGSFNLSKGDYSIIDFSGLKSEIMSELFDAFENEDHVVYIECGKFDPSMYRFNME